MALKVAGAVPASHPTKEYVVIDTIRRWIRWNITTPICHLLGIVAPTDWISCYSFMSKKILPYLKQYRKHEKSGVPMAVYTDENYGAEMRGLGYTWDANSHNWEGTVDGIEAHRYMSHKWDKIIDEMIFALEYTAKDDPDDDCMVPNPLYNPDQKECFFTTPIDDGRGCSELKFNEDYGETKIDMDLLRAKGERVQKGYDLLGKYWQSIWD